MDDLRKDLKGISMYGLVSFATMTAVLRRMLGKVWLHSRSAVVAGILGVCLLGSLYGQGTTEAELAEFSSEFKNLLAKVVKEQLFTSEYGTFYHNAVDYKVLSSDKKVELLLKRETKRLAELSEVPSVQGHLAFWLNAYNFYTLEAIASRYPVKSMKEIGWKRKNIVIGGETFSIDDIEHEKLRMARDARVHFALNCASVSCPSLRLEPYQESDLNKVLDEQTVAALRSPMHIRLVKAGFFGSERVGVSKIFSWYKKDFTDGGTSSIEAFILKYAPEVWRQRLEKGLAFVTYDWRTNEVGNIASYWAKISLEAQKDDLGKVRVTQIQPQ